LDGFIEMDEFMDKRVGFDVLEFRKAVKKPQDLMNAIRQDTDMKARFRDLR